MSSTTPSSPDVTTRISVDRNDRHVVLAVEDPSPGGTSIVAAVDPLVDRQVLERLVDELLAELDRVHVDGPELADESGYHLSTIYPAIRRLDMIVKHNFGSVAFRNPRIAECVTEPFNTPRILSSPPAA